VIEAVYLIIQFDSREIRMCESKMFESLYFELILLMIPIA